MARGHDAMNGDEPSVDGYYGESAVNSSRDVRQYQSPSPRRFSRPTDLERRHARRRSEGRGSRSESRTETRGDGSRQIEDVLKYIQQDWDFMTEEKCVPIQIALKLMDDSSLGLANRYEEYLSTQEQLQKALKAIVNEHHQGFNSSIGTFHSIQASIQSSQHRIQTLKDSLVRAKSNLSTTRPELRGWAASSQNYDEILQILSLIEQLRLTPATLEARISEKRFLSAVGILQDALRIVRRPELEPINALDDLRVYFANQEQSMTEILIEELHNHLYLKSPYCEDRWKAYAGLHHQSGMLMNGVSTKQHNSADLYQFLETLDSTEPLREDVTGNPETNTFAYIQLLLEALNAMSRLDLAVDRTEQRLPTELFHVVDKSNGEVNKKHPSSVRSRAKGAPELAYNQDGGRRAVLSDLLTTLYARFEAIAEGHRVMHEVIRGIVARESSSAASAASSLTRGFSELWKLYQSEVTYTMLFVSLESCKAYTCT